MNFFLKKTISVILLMRAMNLIGMESDFLNFEMKKEVLCIPEFSYISIRPPKNERLEILDILDFEPLTKQRWLTLIQETLTKNVPHIMCRRMVKNSAIYQDARTYIEQVYESDLKKNAVQIIETNPTQYFAIGDFNGTSEYIGNSADLLFKRENNILFRTLNFCCSNKNTPNKSGYFLGKHYLKKEKYALARLFLLHALEKKRDNFIKKNKIGLKLSDIRLKLGSELERIIPLIQNFVYSVLQLHSDVITEIATMVIVTEPLIEQLAAAKFIDKYTKLKILQSLKEKENESCLTLETLISSHSLPNQAMQFLNEKLSLSPQNLSRYIKSDYFQEQKMKLIRNAWILLGDCYIQKSKYTDPVKARACYDKAQKMTTKIKILEMLSNKKRAI